MNKTRPALEHLPKITLLWLSGISEFTSPDVDIGGYALPESQLLSESTMAVCQDPCLWPPALELAAILSLGSKEKPDFLHSAFLKFEVSFK